MAHLPRKFVDDRTAVSVKDYGAIGNGIVDDFTAIMAAHNGLPSGGGTISLPPGTYSVSGELAFTKPIHLHMDRATIITDNTSSILISTTSSLIIEGISPFDSVLIPKVGGSAILIKPRTYTENGKEIFQLKNIKIAGGGRGVNTEGLTGFYGGQFTIEDCFFESQSDVSVWMESSVFYSFIGRTQFSAVNGAIFVKDNCELRIHHVTVELDRTSTKPCIEARGAAHLDIDSCELFVRRPNPSPDVLLYSSADNLDGITWIRNTKLSPEGLTDLRTGAHVRVYDVSHPQNSFYQLNIENCKFYAPSPLSLISIGRSGGTVTATVETIWPEGHALQVGDKTAIGFILANSSFNGTFTVTAVGAVTGTGPYHQTLQWSQSTLPDVGQSNLGGIISNAGLSAIQFTNPVTHARIVGNEMLGYAYGVDDSAAVNSTILDVSGTHSYEDNKITGTLGYAWSEFKNAGHGFTRVVPRVGSRFEHSGGPPHPNE
ncbi:MAG TPA: glycosyl hydrolase family 28-related protein, partial [Anaerovoracaceae bacterium]|nr:glycosyl hydrolase family 28-related protein [Anaerovoracaceae bacterium]